MKDLIRILLVDDHPVLRAGLKALLEGEGEFVVIGEAGTGEEGIEKVKELRPDVVVMDLSMPGIGGLEATRRIAALGLGTKVLVLTVHAEEEYLLPVVQAGGSGYVLKRSADTDLMDGLRTVARGQVFLYPTTERFLLRRYRDAAEDKKEGLALLSSREREVLAQTAQGYSSTEIGRRLFISPKTVDTYRARIMEKLRLNHRSELVRFALRTGLLRAS